MAQRRSQDVALNGGRRGATATKAIFTAGEQEGLVTVQVPKRLFIDGGLERTKSVVETMVSQQAGPSMLPPQLQSAPVRTPPEPSGPYSSSMSTRYAQLPVAACEGAGVGGTVDGGDEVHVKYLNHHLRGHLELPGAHVGAVSVDILLNSGAVVTAFV